MFIKNVLNSFRNVLRKSRNRGEREISSRKKASAIENTAFIENVNAF